MKRFTLLVIAAWLAMFALSLRPINGNDPKYWGILDNLTVSFNEHVVDICQSCAYPDKPFVEAKGMGEYEVAMPHQLPIVDNRMTHAILVNTFWFMVFAMGAVNLFFYLGTGAIGRGASTTMQVALVHGGNLQAILGKIGRHKTEKETVEPSAKTTQLAEAN
jgi:hypothetical protein